MGRVFFNTRKNIHNLTANYTCLESDSGKTFIVLPAATTDITLPAPGDVSDGWNCTVILQSDSGFGGDAIMDQKVNIDMSADTNNVGIIHGGDAGGSDQAVDGDGDNMLMQAHSLDGTDRQVTAADVLSLVSPEKGDLVDLVCDGTSWYVNAWVADDGHAALA